MSPSLVENFVAILLKSTHAMEKNVHPLHLLTGQASESHFWSLHRIGLMLYVERNWIETLAQEERRMKNKISLKISIVVNSFDYFCIQYIDKPQPKFNC